MQIRLDNCEPCPVQCELGRQESRAQTLYNTVKAVAEQALSGAGGEAVDAQIQALAEQGSLEPEEAEEFRTKLRASVATDLDTLEAELETVQARRRQLLGTCVRPLVLQGRTDNGQMLSVLACTAPEVYNNGEMHVPVHTFRSLEGQPPA